MMTFAEFLRDYPTILTQSPSVLLLGKKEYPLLFFSLFFDACRKLGTQHVSSLDMQNFQLQDFYAQTATSFLGMRTIYWLHNIAELEEKKRKHLVGYVQAYKGPHCIVYFDYQTSSAQYIVELADTITKSEFDLLMRFIEGDQKVPRAERFKQELFSRCDVLLLDQACLLLWYHRLVGTSQQQFFDTWFNSLIIPTRSLFMVSQYLFNKSAAKFFMYWAEIEHDYPPQFWISFWSDQVWRAYHFITLMQEKKFADAKAVSFRLPFSFMQHDWKKIEPAELRAAHQFLYDCDVALKNGVGTMGLDLFYSKFLCGEFRD